MTSKSNSKHNKSVVCMKGITWLFPGPEIRVTQCGYPLYHNGVKSFLKVACNLVKNQNCYKHLNKHVKINILTVFWYSKIEILWKLAQKVDFRKILDPILGFSTKKGFTIRESPNFVIPFGTKNHKMWGPPVYCHIITSV